MKGIFFDNPFIRTYTPSSERVPQKRVQYVFVISSFFGNAVSSSFRRLATAPEVKSCRSAMPESGVPATKDFQNGSGFGRKSTEKLCFAAQRYRLSPRRLPHFCVRKLPQRGHCGLR